MIRLLAAVCLLASLVLVQVAQADSVDDALAALKQSAVYVAPGTEDTNSDTAGVLASPLNDGDSIVIVMLPASALKGQNGVLAIARKIDNATGNKRIVGLSVGDQTVGYSQVLPVGVAADLMARARSVSVDTDETLLTFIRNIHDYQAQNPGVTPGGKPEDGGFPWGFVLLAILLVLVGLGVVAFVGLKKESTGENIRFRSPEAISGNLERIMELRKQVSDETMRSVLLQVCQDSEVYFKRNTKKSESDTREFSRHLESVRSVLERYIDIQDNPRYFDQPRELRAKGLGAVRDFSAFVLESIRRGSRHDLTEFSVDTDILSAKRYS